MLSDTMMNDLDRVAGEQFTCPQPVCVGECCVVSFCLSVLSIVQCQIRPRQNVSPGKVVSLRRST